MPPESSHPAPTNGAVNGITRPGYDAVPVGESSMASVRRLLFGRQLADVHHLIAQLREDLEEEIRQLTGTHKDLAEGLTQMSTEAREALSSQAAQLRGTTLEETGKVRLSLTGLESQIERLESRLGQLETHFQKQLEAVEAAFLKRSEAAQLAFEDRLKAMETSFLDQLATLDNTGQARLRKLSESAGEAVSQVHAALSAALTVAEGVFARPAEGHATPAETLFGGLSLRTSSSEEPQAPPAP